MARAGRAACVLSALLGPAAALVSADALVAGGNPVQQVVTLLTDMKTQVEAEAKQDLAAYDKYMCWCQTNEKEKTAAIAVAEQQISDLNAFLEEAVGREGQLKTEISQLAQSIADDQTALQTAATVRAKEEAAFKAEEADTKETRGLLASAVDTLSKVQLVQKGARAPTPEARKAAAQALLQVRDVVIKRYPQYHSVMQRDLFDVLGSLEQVEQQQLGQQQARAALLGESFLPRKGAALDQAQTNQPKSYNSQSGAIVGILSGMHDQFTRDLSAAQRADLDAEIQFQHLRAAKTGEIAAASAQKKQKEAELADLLASVAQAKGDLEAVTAALTADQTFLVNLQQNCKTEDEQYKGRAADRSEEVRALGEALQILTEDDARDLFGKTVGFLQLAAQTGRKDQAVAVSSAAERLALQDRATERAMQRIARVARSHRNWALASLAVRVRLDTFEKVKEAMDKMLAELAKQQKEEYEKREFCNKAIDEAEDSIKERSRTKQDLAEKHLALSNTIDTLAREIEELKTEVKDMEVALKQAGEQRKASNQLFQQSIADQRATINILQKAQKRLQQFYALVSVHSHRQTPGAAVAPPPPKPQGYEKHGTAGGVLQLLAVIVNDAERTEVQLKVGEQKAQEVYARFVSDTAASIEGDRALIQQKEAQAASAAADKSEVQAAQLGNDQELEKLNGILQAHHVDCDFLLQYFDTRQKARAEEIDSINDAKAILSGATFGK